LSSIFGLPIKEKKDHRKAILEASNIHAAKILAVAFSRKFNDEEWKQAKQQARKLVTRMLSRDIEQLDDILHQLSAVEKSPDASPLRPISSNASLWDRIRSSISPPDIDGLAVLIQCTTQGSLLLVVPPSRLNLNEKSTAKSSISQVLNRVNTAISTIHNGFDKTLMKFVDAMSDASLKLLCNREDVAPYLIPLFLSPAKSLSDGAQALVGQAYNVDNRVDCFRALLENQSTITVESLIHSLQAFDRVTKGYLEAVDAAKVLVRCYADVLEVLCTRGTGLLFDESFKKRETKLIQLLPTLWKYMCAAAGTIVNLTPSWALRYPPEEMVPWMRDALIFAEGLIDQRHVFESCVLKPEDFDLRLSGSPTKPSANGEDIIHDLSKILRPMAGWLRLTNPELLDRSYNLLLSLLEAFKVTGTIPEETVLATLEASLKRLSNKVAKKDGATTGASTKLSMAQLGTLNKRLGELQGLEDSDVEFIYQLSPQKPPQTSEAKTRFVPPLAPVFLQSKQPTSTKMPSKTPSLVKSKPKEPISKPRTMGSNDSAYQRMDQEMIRLAIEERKAGKLASNLKSSKVPPQDDESSESDSGSESPSGLQQLSKLHISPVKGPRQERRGAILLNGISMGPNTAQNQNNSSLQTRNASRRGVRYIPDMSTLHRVILNWDYKHDGPEPPISGGQLTLKAVPDTFSSHRHYLDIFYPLIILECWNSLVKSKEEQLEKVNCIINSKMHADLWVEIDITIEQSVERGWVLSDTDIVLLEHASGQQRLAKVHSARQVKQGLQATIRYSAEISSIDFDRSMTLQSSWTVSRVYR
jgi:senataxin